MTKSQHKLKLSAWVIVGSFLILLITMALSNPLDNPFLAILIFILMAFLLIATGYFLTTVRGREINSRRRFRIMLITSLILVGLMLRSAGSLDLGEAGVLLLIGAGLWFYSGRR